MIKRSDKLAFMQVNSEEGTVFKRMSGFTEFSISKNPKEYSRKYIDEDTERTAVVSYSPAISYKFDFDPENDVHGVFAGVADRELLGDDTVVNVVLVDLSSQNDLGANPAMMRSFNIIPGNEGDDTDTYTYSGSLKASGTKVFGSAISSDDFETITFNEE